MANLKAIRKRIVTVTSIQQVTRAMKLVAAAKLRRAQQQMEQARPYAYRINGMLKHLLPSIDRNLHPLLTVREPERRAFVIITADRGLCGSFNTHILRFAHDQVDAAGGREVPLICIGKKGRDYFQNRGYNVMASYTHFWRDLNFNHAVEYTAEITRHYLQQSFNEVTVIYNNFRNVIQQEVVAFRYLPLVLEPGEEVEAAEYLFEPSPEEVVRSLIPRHLTVQMWRFLLESNAAEQAARMTAMDNATENAGEVIRTLTLEYNKARQAAITKEILEVVSGAEALMENM